MSQIKPEQVHNVAKNLVDIIATVFKHAVFRHSGVIGQTHMKSIKLITVSNVTVNLMTV